MNDLIELLAEKHQVICVSYKEKEYYVFAYDDEEIHLVETNIDYYKTTGDELIDNWLSPGDFTFFPLVKYIQYIKKEDPEYQKILNCIEYYQFYVRNVFFVECRRFYPGSGNSDLVMRIVEEKKELPVSSTGRYYRFKRDHYEIES